MQQKKKSNSSEETSKASEEGRGERDKTPQAVKIIAPEGKLLPELGRWDR
jgi:hypothetical protein